MKNICSALLLAILFAASPAVAGELKVGDKVPDFRLDDALNSKPCSLNSSEFAGRVLFIIYGTTGTADDNDHVIDAINADSEIQRSKSAKKFDTVGIGNLKYSPVPNFIIKQVCMRKQKKTGGIILLDPEFIIGNLWGTPRKEAFGVLVDRNRVVRYVFQGKLPKSEVPTFLNLIRELSK